MDSGFSHQVNVCLIPSSGFHSWKGPCQVYSVKMKNVYTYTLNSKSVHCNVKAAVGLYSVFTLICSNWGDIHYV